MKMNMNGHKIAALFFMVSGAGVGGSGAVEPGQALSTGCGGAVVVPGTYTLSTLDGAGIIRRYDVVIPVGYNDTVGHSVVYAFHAAGGTAAQARAWGFQNQGTTHPILVAPQGRAYLGYGIGWDDSCTGYDMAFFENMRAHIEATYCVDKAKRYVAGFSWGGDFATALTCCKGAEISAAAVASASDEFTCGKNYSPTDYKTYQNYASCTGVQNKTDIRMTHDALNYDSAYRFPFFSTTEDLFRAWNSCTTAQTTVGACKHYTCTGKAFWDCGYTGLGHAIPSTWVADSWAFFSTN